MTEVRKTGNYEQWILFFLRAIEETADDAIETIDKLTALHTKNTELIKKEPSRVQNNLMSLLSYLEKNPIIDVKKTSDALSLSYNTAAKYVDIFCDKGILSQTSKVGKAKIYSYSSYLEILRKDT